MQRRSLLRTLGALPVAGLATRAGTAHAQASASPITAIVPFAAGGNLDVTARVVMNVMARVLGQPIVIDNRGGAGGIIGQEAVARAAPDGKTLLITANGSLFISPRLQGKRPFTIASFAPIGMMAVTPLVLEVPAASPHASFEAFLAQARAQPGRLSIAHPGNGTTNHVAISTLQDMAGASFNAIPYKGSGPALNDVLGRQVDAMMDQLPSSLPHIKAGKLRALAVTTPERSPDLPDVPTLSELGLKGFDVSTVSGLLAPAGTPASVTARLNAALNQALADPEVRQRLAAMGSQPRPMSVADFGAYIAAEDDKAEQFVKRTGLDKTA